MTRRHSPAVYRRRRIVVFGGLLVLLAGIGVGIWLLLAQPWAAAAEAGPDPVVSPEPVDDAVDLDDAAEDAASEEVVSDEADAEELPEDPEETPEAPAPCTSREIEVVPVTDATSYRSGAMPQLSIQLTNVSGSDCTMNVGSSTQVFTITSGSDVWWRSTDCQTEPSDMVATIEAGQTVTSAEPVEWNRERSSVRTCDAESRQRAPAGGASYHVTVEIGGIDSVASEQILLY